MQLTTEQVNEMAPDAASIAAGKKLAVVRSWLDVGKSAAALWGQCQGSALYQTKIDLSNLGYACSCPSRKFPCKHVLGLLMLEAATPDAVGVLAEPEWVTVWLAKRAEKAEKKAAKEEAPAKPVDEKAAQKRADQREGRVRSGLERLDLWMRDIIRNGLAGLESKPHTFWDEQAKRLVDAQAGGLASRVARLATIPNASRDWPRQLLGEIARIKLAVEAFGRLESLSPDLQRDLKQYLGWNIGAEELNRDGERVTDDWIVLGQWTDDDDRVRAQRSWLVGRATGRTALVLQFSAGGQPFPEVIVAGTEQRGSLLFYPGAAKQRAKWLEREGAVGEITARIPGGTIETLLEQTAEQIAAQPWLGAFAAVLHDVTCLVREQAWWVRDAAGNALPLRGRDHWRLLSITGGHPFDLTAEFDGRRLRPLGLVVDGRFKGA